MIFNKTIRRQLHQMLVIPRSIRRSVRSGSIKLKQTYEHLMENGDIGAGMNRVNTARNRPHDLDIKLLQAKRQQAEMRRSVYYLFSLQTLSRGNYKNAGLLELEVVSSSSMHFIMM